MKYLTLLFLLLTLSSCKQKKVPPYDRDAVNRGADSILANSFILAARESGMPSYYNLDRRELVVEVDTSTMTGSVDSFALSFFNIARENGVKPIKCIVREYYSKDTLTIYE